jgi:hypothetical protein
MGYGVLPTTTDRGGPWNGGVGTRPVGSPVSAGTIHCGTGPPVGRVRVGGDLHCGTGRRLHCGTGPPEDAAPLDRDDRTEPLVRRNLPSDGKYVSGVESGTQARKGTGRLDTNSISVDIGRTAARRVVASPRIGYIRSGSTRR